MCNILSSKSLLSTLPYGNQYTLHSNNFFYYALSYYKYLKRVNCGMLQQFETEVFPGYFSYYI